MGYIVISAYLKVTGEYESIDAAIQAIKNRVGLYANSVKVMKIYKDRFGNDAAFISFLNVTFNIRQPAITLQDINEQKEVLEQKQPLKLTNDEKRNHRIGDIISSSIYHCPGKFKWKIWKRLKADSGNTVESSAEKCGIVNCLEYNGVCDDGCGWIDHCAFNTKRLASLVLAWYAVVRESAKGHSKDIKYLKDTFDKVLDTFKYREYGYVFYVKAIKIPKDEDDDEYFEGIVNASKLRLPVSFEIGIGVEPRKKWITRR